MYWSRCFWSAGGEAALKASSACCIAAIEVEPTEILADSVPPPDETAAPRRSSAVRFAAPLRFGQVASPLGSAREFSGIATATFGSAAETVGPATCLANIVNGLFLAVS